MFDIMSSFMYSVTKVTKGDGPVFSATKNKGKFMWRDCSVLAVPGSRCRGWGGTSKGDGLKSRAAAGHPGSGRLWEEVRQRAGWIEFRAGSGRKDARPRQMLLALFGGHVSAMVMGVL